jgi:hypothetical protein
MHQTQGQVFYRTAHPVLGGVEKAFYPFPGVVEYGSQAGVLSALGMGMPMIIGVTLHRRLLIVTRPFLGAFLVKHTMGLAVGWVYNRAGSRRVGPENTLSTL